MNLFSLNVTQDSVYIYDLPIVYHILIEIFETIFHENNK